MKRKIIYLINPISGTKHKAAYVHTIEKRTKEANISFEILHTNPQGNYFFLKDKVENDNVTDIVICGGDGTINPIVRALMDVDVAIGILPMGSGNSLAYCAKIPSKVNKALDIIFKGKGSYVDSFFVNDQFSCALTGIGFDADVAHDFAGQKKRGLATYLRLSFLKYLTATPYPFTITNRGQTLTTEAYFISIANSNQFGNHFTIAPKAALSDGLLDIVVVRKMNKLKLLGWLLFHIRFGKLGRYLENDFNEKDILYFQTDKLIIHNSSTAPVHIDGDPAYPAKKFVIEVIPSAFKLLQP